MYNFALAQEDTREGARISTGIGFCKVSHESPGPCRAMRWQRVDEKICAPEYPGKL